MPKKYIFIPDERIMQVQAEKLREAINSFIDGDLTVGVLDIPGQLIAIDEDGSLELAEQGDDLDRLLDQLDTAYGYVRYIDKQIASLPPSNMLKDREVKDD